MIFPVTEQQQRDGIRKMWDLFPIGAGNPIHLRAIWGKGVPGYQAVKNITFTAAAYASVLDRQRAFEDKALDLNKQGYNVYTCFNPIRPDFKGDEYNGLSVTDADIACRRYLLIDFDRAQTSQPATDEEIDEILAVAHELEQDLFYEKGGHPNMLCSGNGVHIYLPIDLPNDAAGKALCQQMLKAFAEKYDCTSVKVDTSVGNASRITKVPGTVARKGIEVADPSGALDRYYRIASVVE